MRTSSSMQSLGLVLAGFILGIIVTSFGRAGGISGITKSVQKSNAPYPVQFKPMLQTSLWDVLEDSSSAGRTIALGQDGFVRVIVQDDQSSLYVTTYKPGDDVWQGRLMDVGNDGTVEVADISYGHCEAFTAP